jgi:hypothetical protein
MDAIKRVTYQNGEPLFNVTSDGEYVQIWMEWGADTARSAIQNNANVVFPDLREYPLKDLMSNYRDISGQHEPIGVFMVNGPSILVNHSIERIKVYDVAPTILAMKGLPIPEDMDGRVLSEIFKEPLNLNKLSRIPSYEEKAEMPDEKIIISVEDERFIKDRLKSLGYL